MLRPGRASGLGVGHKGTQPVSGSVSLRGIPPPASPPGLSLVEVMGTLLQPRRLASRLGELSAMNPGPVAPTVRNTPKQVQRRLDSNKVDQLVADYLAGAKVRDLADLFRISRNTVLEHVSRAGVRKHYPALIPKQVDEAAQLYRSGRSLVSVGEHFGVNVSTVRTALLKVGVEMRDCHGREHK